MLTWFCFKYVLQYEQMYNLLVVILHTYKIQGGSNMTGTDLYVNKPHCAAAVRP